MSVANLRDTGLPTIVRHAISAAVVRDGGAEVLTDLDADNRPMSVLAVGALCLVYIDDIEYETDPDGDVSETSADSGEGTVPGYEPGGRWTFDVAYIPWNRVRQVSVVDERIIVHTDMDRLVSGDAETPERALDFARRILTGFSGR